MKFPEGSVKFPQPSRQFHQLLRKIPQPLGQLSQLPRQLPLPLRQLSQLPGQLPKHLWQLAQRLCHLAELSYRTGTQLARQNLQVL